MNYSGGTSSVPGGGKSSGGLERKSTSGSTKRTSPQDPALPEQFSEPDSRVVAFHRHGQDAPMSSEVVPGRHSPNEASWTAGRRPAVGDPDLHQGFVAVGTVEAERNEISRG
ncbi:unnamed protein product [Ixodes pacificus]